MTTPPYSEDKLCYYSKSRHAPVGLGANEYVKDPSLYHSLNTIENWRRILSNFYCEPFTYKDKQYNSVEHVFQSYKIALVSPEKAHYFSIDSNHEIGQGDGALAQKNRKLVVLNKQQLEHWDAIKHELMTDITLQRILQSDTYKKVLFATQNAQLWHVISRKGIVRNQYLEDLRDNLKKTIIN
jgi:predicted NAD-dependent protein-ADP-ribosyltransferase YbiA (DUF1768 family)